MFKKGDSYYDVANPNHIKVKEGLEWLIGRDKQLIKVAQDNWNKYVDIQKKYQDALATIKKLEERKPEGELFNEFLHNHMKKLPFTKDVWYQISESWKQLDSLSPKDRKTTDVQFVKKMNEKHNIDNFTVAYLKIMKEDKECISIRRCM